MLLKKYLIALHVPSAALLGCLLFDTAQAQTYYDDALAHPRYRESYQEGFYEELADAEPDADDYRLEGEPGWDYDAYGPNRGVHSPYQYNFGPYNYLPGDTRERFFYTPGEEHDGWVGLDDRPDDRRYWYETHDYEPDRDDFRPRRIDLDFYDPDTRTKLTPDADADPDERIYREAPLDEQTAPRRRQPLDFGTQWWRGDREDVEFAPQAESMVRQDNRRAPQTVRGRTVGLSALMVTDAQPEGAVLVVENANNEKTQVYVTGDEPTMVSPNHWLWRDDMLQVTGRSTEVDGRRVLHAQEITQADSRQPRNNRSQQQATVRGKLTGIYSVRIIDGRVRAALLKLRTSQDKTIGVLLGSRSELLGTSGALVSPGETIVARGRPRRIDQTPLLFASEVVLRDAARRQR